MVTRRKALRGGILVASVLTFALGGASGAGGCGGDDSSVVGGGGDDASTDGFVGNPSDGPIIGAGLDVRASDVTVYVGQTAHLDSSQTPTTNGPVSFAWTVTSVPQGSAITSASLQNPTGETPSFVPDVAGDYAIRCTGTSGAETGSKDVTVHAVNGMVFYTLSNGSGSPPYTEMHAVEMDGKNDHPINCRQRIVLPPVDAGDAASTASTILDFDAGDASDDAGQIATVKAVQGLSILMINMMFADMALDSWEGPAGTPPRAAFQNLEIVNDAGSISLVAATPGNTCQAPPTQVHVVGGASGKAGVWQPRFSSDGQRIAYVEQDGDNDWSIAAVGFDGKDYHHVASYCTTADAGACWGSAFGPRRPQWLDRTTLAWVRVTNTSGTDTVTWEIVKAADATGAPPSTVLGPCTTGAVPLSFAFAANGTIVANYKASKNAPEDLVEFSPTSCTPVRNLTNLTTQGSYGRDFAISPDGTQLAFVRREAPADAGSLDAGTFNFTFGGELYLVPVDGSSAPQPVGGEHLAALFGPRYISAGTRLAWNGEAPPPSGYDSGIPIGQVSEAGVTPGFADGGLPAMNVVKVDGGDVVHVAVGDPANGIYVLGGGNGGGCSLECAPAQCQPQQCGSGSSTCAMTGYPRSGSAVLGSSIWFLAFFWRRRSRKGKAAARTRR